MYLGLREIRAAAGRFGVIAGVVALVAFMVFTLSALTEGLRQQSVSAVEALPGNGLVVQADDGAPAVLSDSQLDPATLLAAQSTGQVTELGIATVRAGTDNRNATVAAFGRSDVHSVTVSPSVADDLSLAVGDTVRIGDEALRVEQVADVGQYAHQPVIEMPVATWQQVTGRDHVNALIADRAPAELPGAVWVERSAVTDLVPGYSSEHMSLLLIQGLLLIVSAVVVGGFFAVWTGQRVGSLAVVRAMGAGRWYLLRDGLGQAVLVLVGGLAVGALLGFGLVSLLSGKAPVAIDPSTMALVLGGMGALGLIGAGLSLRPLVKVDPLTALNR